MLEPGTYVIKLLNSSSNRHIAEVLNEKMDRLYAAYVHGRRGEGATERQNSLDVHEGTGNRPQAMRKWFWPGDTIGQEFVYPKNQAAEIGARTKQKVPEGDLPTVTESARI